MSLSISAIVFNQDYTREFNMINFNANDKLSVNHPLYSSSNTQEDIQHTTTESKANFPEYSHKNCSNLSGFYRGHLITCSAKDSINQLLYEGMDAHEIQTGSNGHSYHEQTLNHIL